MSMSPEGKARWETVARASEVYRLERVRVNGERADQTRVMPPLVVARRRLAVHVAYWPNYWPNHWPK